MKLEILNGHLIDPANQREGQHHLFIADGIIVGIDDAPAGFIADKTIDATGLTVIPGIVDLCARLREPGQEYAATIGSEAAAAVKGGITTLCIPPDTDPVVDATAVVELIDRRRQQTNLCNIHTIGALTQGLQGQHLSEMARLQSAGCLGVSNALSPIKNTLIQRRAMEYAASLNFTVFINPADPWLHTAGCMHEGQVSVRLGLTGIPETSETIALARDLLLIEQTGVSAHFHHITSKTGVDMIKNAQTRGIDVSADVTLHHLHLTEHDINNYDALCHVQPPLRSLRDRDSLRQAVKEGAITAITASHKPLDADDKLGPFAESQPGISGLETLLPLTLKLVDDKILPLNQAIANLTINPAKILGIDTGHLGLHASADLCIFASDIEATCQPQHFISAGKNSPFTGWALNSSIIYTLVNGKIVYSSG